MNLTLLLTETERHIEVSWTLPQMAVSVDVFLSITTYKICEYSTQPEEPLGKYFQTK